MPEYDYTDIQSGRLTHRALAAIRDRVLAGEGLTKLAAKAVFADRDFWFEQALKFRERGDRDGAALVRTANENRMLKELVDSLRSERDAAIRERDFHRREECMREAMDSAGSEVINHEVCLERAKAIAEARGWRTLFEAL